MEKQRPALSLIDQLREAITDSGLSLNELRRRSGVDHGQLSRFMRGERDITFAAAARVCAALGLGLVRLTNSGDSAKPKGDRH